MNTVFRSATLGPSQSHMAYCRILLPHLLGVSRLIYLDCDVLVFAIFLSFSILNWRAAKSLRQFQTPRRHRSREDSRGWQTRSQLPAEGTYFNSGVMLMNLDELRRQHFFERAVEFLNVWKSNYRFHDQSAINFLLQGQIEELPEYWNRASWRFDAQQNNDLDCLLHYTRFSAVARWSPQAQLRSCLNDLQWRLVCLSIGSHRGFKRSVRQNFCEMRLHLCEHLLFQSYRCFTELPGEKRSALLSRNRALLARLHFQYAEPAAASSPDEPGN